MIISINITTTARTRTAFRSPAPEPCVPRPGCRKAHRYTSSACCRTWSVWALPFRQERTAPG